MRDLQWAKLNFLHTTDTHGWYGGHLQESQYSADWGDYISFAHHLRKQADEKGADLLLVDTGDRVEGNGLYDASTPKGEYTYDIYREQDIDIICTGNHELYQTDTADREHEQTVPNFKNNYIASNLDYIDPKTGKQIPMAQRYRKFKTKNQGVEIVAFGFLFDFTGNANNTVVQPVEETIKEDWFKQAITEKPDLFVVIGHVGAQMEEFKTIFAAIRRQNWFTPIAFFGGHAHVRDATSYDAKSFVMASGRYFETIGWMSIDGIKPKAGKEDAAAASAAVTFNRRYIDNNILGLYHHSGLNETTFPTEHGRNVSRMITEARKALDLDHKYGCAPQDYWMARSEYPSDDNIFTLIQREILPGVIVSEERKGPRLAIMNTGAIRFDIFEGAFTRDTTYIISPFLSKMNYVPDVPYNIAKKVIKLLNSAGKIFEEPRLDMRYLAIPEQWARTESIVYSKSETTNNILLGDGSQKPLGDDSKRKPDLVGGYTTKDDIGTDGDDAIHSPLDFYLQPNCIQSEIDMPSDGDPETVDLVFTDFIQPWITVALKFSGGDYSDNDVLLWKDAAFTDMMADWIKENWKGNC
ncbi:Ser/Thr protein phosphatase [Pleurostoma richardsiae]|uniref:Ser/Thr protein phosphatase n=1 Tax=Pleurostoma richardsiae TaxID=41990 RepID=A0AA38S3D3_9PEZI|nr:Ser/Thr protein phosphatase [Pleurostoma richardsiae]